MYSMQVTKRDGSLEDVSFDKVLTRIRKAAETLEVDPVLISQRVVSRIYQGVRTSELDELTANLAISLATTNPDYATLAARIAISNHQKNTPTTWLAAVDILAAAQKHNLSPTYIDFVRRWAFALEPAIDYQRDFLLDYFGFKTLELQHYLMRDPTGRVIERPQHLWMRVAAALWLDKMPAAADTTPQAAESILNQIRHTYELLSTQQYIHATPTNFNAGTIRQQMSSCFLLAMKDDSISGIYDTLKDCAQISKHAGGIGLHINNVRAKGSHIAGTNGTSNGIVPMLRNFNMTARYVDQGGGKRNGSFAIYLEPWHADVEDFLKLKTPQGAEEERARDLFYALWVPDLFMERVEADAEWTLFCPHEAPGLADCHGDAFRELYERYEQEGRGKRKVSAQKLWFKILDSQIETGTPYILYKDAANAKSNQQNLGTIKSSNLCCEIIEYSSPEETAVCNLASLSLPAFVQGKTFDYARLRRVVATAVINLNRVIDINYYPTEECRRSNMRHRPIGLGVQGLADVFALLRAPWESDRAADINQRIAEHIYYAAVETSAALAAEEGHYLSYHGSPASKGQLQPDLWGVTPLTQQDGSLDWAALRASVAHHGLRNSLLIAPMPTASTSQILGNTECFEPVLTNIFTRRTRSGEYIVINKHLMRELRRYDVWNEQLKQKIIAQNGSVQGLDEVPEPIQKLFKTAWEIKQRTLIDLAAGRGAFICQSQSLNLFVADPTYAKLTSMHFYGWKRGLKTGIYYLRTRAPVMAQKFTVDPEIQAEAERAEAERQRLAGQADEGCLVCSA